MTLEGGTIKTGTTNDLANLDDNTSTLTLASSAALTTSTGCSRDHRRKGPEITTPYAAVLLDDNQPYYGKLTNAGSGYPELTDV